jgi:Rieske 2Fe-2S family protein
MDIQAGYNGLTALTPGLTAEAYYDPRQYDLEMRRIWRRNWVYVCRSSEVATPRSFVSFELGDQRILLVRDEQGALRGFYNTCRHRGAQLCTEAHGTLRSNALVCPYHAWVYSLDGSLVRTSSKITQQGFELANYSLYPVRVNEWRGFIYVALTDSPPEFASIWDVPVTQLDRWPLEDLAVGHVMNRTITCNWKIFWENYNECLHCPSVHPQLSNLVPIYGRGLLEERDDPQWQNHESSTDPRWKGGLRAGAKTWSLDGKVTGTAFSGLPEQDLKFGYSYMTGIPSTMIAAHADYVRVIRLLPLGPETTQMRVEYLFSKDTLADQAASVRNAVDFTNTVLAEDADVCELTQRGLRAAPHSKGVLMPEEYLLRQFHEWMGRQLAPD